MSFGNYPLIDGGTLGLNNYAVIAVTPTVKADGSIGSAVWLQGQIPNPYRIDEEPSSFVSALEADGRTFAPLDEYGGDQIYIASDTPFASAAIQTWVAPEGGDWCAVYLDDLAPFIVAGERGDVEASLLPGTSGGSSTSRNTYDGYSSTLSNLSSAITDDANRTITAQEIVAASVIVWAPTTGGTVPRQWTMPDLAAMDAFITDYAAGRPLTDPGSGGRSIVIYNRSLVPLSILDASDFPSLSGSYGYTIPPGEVATLTWGCPSVSATNGTPTGPGSPVWDLVVGSAQPRAGQVWAAAAVLPASGDPVPGYSFGNVASTGYTPGSGMYGFTFAPVPAGWTYLVMTSTSNSGLAVVGGNTGGPGVCTVIAQNADGSPWADSIPFHFAIVLVPPPPAGP